MDKYYYIVSQLPMLFFDKEAEIGIDYFLEETRKWLRPVDFTILSQIELDNFVITERGPKLLQEFIRFEFQFRSELAQWRKSLQSGQEYKPISFPLSLVKEGNPLAIERRLLKRKWDFIEEIEHGHHFDLEYLILYYLKLQILQKLQTYNKDKGMEIFQNTSRIEI